jgi:putative transposase
MNATSALRGFERLRRRFREIVLGQYRNQVLPHGRRYERGIAEDLSLMFLTGISTRNLSLISRLLLGHKLSYTKISEVNKELSDAIEQWEVP